MPRAGYILAQTPPFAVAAVSCSDLGQFDVKGQVCGEKAIAGADLALFTSRRRSYVIVVAGQAVYCDFYRKLSSHFHSVGSINCKCHSHIRRGHCSAGVGYQGAGHKDDGQIKKKQRHCRDKNNN